MEIKFNNVSYQTILQDININLKSNKINGIMGHSGSGKTTLIELINALRLPTIGEITVDETTINSKFKPKDINKFRVNIGLVYEFPEQQFFNNTVEEELEFSLKYFNIPTSEIKKNITKALNSVDLDSSYLNRDPFTLSHGEKRKVALASILAFNPKILILDEPTLGLDGKSQKQIINLIKTLQVKEKKTIIIVSKNPELIYNLCNYVYLIDKGKIVLEDEKYTFFNNEEIKKYGVIPPKIVNFINLVKQKKSINLPMRDDIDDLIKDIYRYAK